MSLKKQQKQQQQQQRCYRQRLTDFRRSNTLLIFAVFMASWLDNFLLTVVVPIVPQYIAKLDAIAREKDMMTGVTDGMLGVTDEMMAVIDSMPVTDGMEVTDRVMVTDSLAVTDWMEVREMMNMTERSITMMEQGRCCSDKTLDDNFMNFLFGEYDMNFVPIIRLSGPRILLRCALKTYHSRTKI